MWLALYWTVMFETVQIYLISLKYIFQNIKIPQKENYFERQQTKIHPRHRLRIHHISSGWLHVQRYRDYGDETSPAYTTLVWTITTAFLVTVSLLLFLPSPREQSLYQSEWYFHSSSQVISLPCSAPIHGFLGPDMTWAFPFPHLPPLSALFPGHWPRCASYLVPFFLGSSPSLVLSRCLFLLTHISAPLAVGFPGIS